MIIITHESCKLEGGGRMIGKLVCKFSNYLGLISQIYNLVS